MHQDISYSFCICKWPFAHKPHLKSSQPRKSPLSVSRPPFDQRRLCVFFSFTAERRLPMRDTSENSFSASSLFTPT